MLLHVFTFEDEEKAVRMNGMLNGRINTDVPLFAHSVVIQFLLRLSQIWIVSTSKDYMFSSYLSAFSSDKIWNFQPSCGYPH